MNRPPSIVMFDRLYLGSIALGLINTALGWNARMQEMQRNPAMIENPEMASTMTTLMPVFIVVGTGISLLLWYLVARRGSVVAKWFVVVFAGFGAIGALTVLFALLTGRAPSLLGAVLGLVATGLSIAAAVMLFRPDAQPWFGKAPALQDTFE